MGQYYRACFINDTKDNVLEFFSSYDTDNGAKLMEHSYIGNMFVLNVSYKLINSPKRLVWAGDYGDKIVGDNTYYALCDNAKKSQNEVNIDEIKDAINSNTIYINYDKKEWFDIKKQTIPYVKAWDIIAHPLPILTADCGCGGGDYDGALIEMVGIWKGDLIGISDIIPSNYKEIEPWFTELSQKDIDEYFEKLKKRKKK